jgi:modification methylase
MFFDGRAEIAALILSNGHIRWRDVTGSIHQVGKVIQNGPCNGWERWYHADEQGELVVINALRELARQKMGLG